MCVKSNWTLETLHLISVFPVLHLRDIQLQDCHSPLGLGYTGKVGRPLAVQQHATRKDVESLLVQVLCQFQTESSITTFIRESNNLCLISTNAIDLTCDQYRFLVWSQNCGRSRHGHDDGNAKPQLKERLADP